MEEQKQKSHNWLGGHSSWRAGDEQERILRIVFSYPSHDQQAIYTLWNNLFQLHLNLL